MHHTLLVHDAGDAGAMLAFDLGLEFKHLLPGYTCTYIQPPSHK